MARERIQCECGQTLSRPVPPVCPGCQRRIVAVRRGVGSIVWPWLLIGGSFAMLIGFLYWLLTVAS